METQSAIQLTREQQARLNNLRAVVKRQLRPTSSVDPSMVASILLKNSEMMREAGLAQEQLDYLLQIRDRTAEGSSTHAILTTHVAVMKDAIDELRDEAEIDHKMALDEFKRVDGHAVQNAEAHIAYGRHLIDISQIKKAAEHYQKAIDLLKESDDNTMSAVAQGELGRAYTARGQFDTASDHFEKALARLPAEDENLDDVARIKADYATVLIQLKDLKKAESLLKEALEVCDKWGLWVLRGQVRRELAYIEQMRADEAQDNAVIKAHLDNAETILKQTVTDLLPVSDTLGLAVAYHDLGRLEARRKKFDDAFTHVMLSIEMFERLGNKRNLAVAHITLGQLKLLRDGDAANAVKHLHTALSIADKIEDVHTEKQAAESLVRVHELQSRRALNDRLAIRMQVIDQITFTRAKLMEVDLPNFASRLDPLITKLEAVDANASQ
jgi:tetratricopeptide (TPR) repeat protein